MIHGAPGLPSSFFAIFRTKHVICEHDPSGSNMPGSPPRLAIRGNQRTHFRAEHGNRHNAVTLLPGVHKTLFGGQSGDPKRWAWFLGWARQRSRRGKTVKTPFVAYLLFFKELAYHFDSLLES